MTNAIEWWLKPRTFISLSFWKLEGVDQDVCMVGFWWGPSSWLVDGSFLTVSSCGWEIPHVEALWCLSLTHYWLGNFYRNQHLGLAIFLLASQKLILSSVQFTHSVMSESLQPHGLQHARPPCPSPTPRVYSDSCPFSHVMPSSHLILCHPIFFLPSIFPSIRVFSNESFVRIRWPKYWSFSFNISPSSEHPGLISFMMDWLDLLAVQGTLKSLLQHHSSKASIPLLIN